MNRIVSGLTIGATVIALASGCHAIAGHAIDEREWSRAYESAASGIEAYGGHPCQGHYYRDVDIVMLAGTPYLVFREIKSYADDMTVIDYSLPLSATARENVQLREVSGLTGRITITVDRFAPIVATQVNYRDGRRVKVRSSIDGSVRKFSRATYCSITIPVQERGDVIVEALQGLAEYFHDPEVSRSGIGLACD